MSRHSSSPLIPSVFSNLLRTALTGLGALALTSLALPASAAIPVTERAVLVSLYNDTDGANWTNNTSWMGTAGTECSWHGISCDGTGHVTRIDLGTNGLSGTLPDLSALTALKDFNVGNNGNGLNGPLPALPPSIRQFWAFGNNLSGPIPDLSALTALERFFVGENGLSGPLPALPPSIIRFYAGDNNLSGPIPNLSALTALEHFYVFVNNLSGPLPALPPSIKHFWAFGNDLSGPIPDLSALTALGHFYVNNNDLSGPLPALPPSITEFLVHNNRLSGAPASAPPASIDYAEVCPNYLELSGDPAINAAWEAATFNTPWNKGCTSVPPAPIEATAIPTLSAWSLALLSILLGGIAIWRRPNAA